ncbi:Imidazole glycerol phosphate synthase subunit HisH [Candidatus Bilamarchaeum dharawalense]|uniref:Imidazole glycerol phosphate synthase subunit HisH n=1 Tax=Candidatus Bilamarchaeum dharawalense TaxID=2885759 RepID=A0A5E4LPV0_9ARCH|nr:Imidazole glycerol phosphate synthase subunit HisH [Candidatus Bilamarchaeum dharawalense]
MIAIIDYGAGNTANVKNAFTRLGAETMVSSNPKLWEKADGLILPGVGSFGAAMQRIEQNSSELASLIKQKPFLGICLGMQLMFEKSEESQGVSGLGIINGSVKKFNGDLPVPHTGWNLVSISDATLLDGISDFYAYFVHSYYCEPADKRLTMATTNYGKKFPSIIARKNILLTQFHPEKSGESGLLLLKNFIKEVRK